MLKSLLPVKILRVDSSVQERIFSTKSGGSLLIIFNKCAILESDI